jgi:hypothetical protein
VTSFREYFWATAIAVLFVSVAPLANAQDQRSVLEGFVVDESGSALPGVIIALTAVGEKTAVRVATDAHGHFTLHDLASGTFTLSAELSGFQTFFTTLAVPRAQPLRLILKVGALVETVTISSDLPSLRQMTATGPTVNGQIRYEVTDEPLAGIRVFITPPSSSRPEETMPGITQADGRFNIRIPEGPRWNRIDIHVRDSGQYKWGKALNQDPADFQLLRLPPMPGSAAELGPLLDELDEERKTGVDPASLAMVAAGIETLHGEFLSTNPIEQQRLAGLQAELRRDQRDPYLGLEAVVTELPAVDRNFARLMLLTPAVRYSMDGIQEMSVMTSAMMDVNGAAGFVEPANSEPPEWMQPPSTTFYERRPLSSAARAVFVRTPAEKSLPQVGELASLRSQEWRSRLKYSVAPRALASDSIALDCRCNAGRTTYQRDTFHDGEAYGGGRVVADHLWLFGAYAYYLDADSQPGTPRRHPARRRNHQAAQRAIVQAGPSFRLEQGYRDGTWSFTDTPDVAEPFETLALYSGRFMASQVNVTQVIGSTTLVEGTVRWAASPHDRARAGSGSVTLPWHYDLLTGFASGGSYGTGDFSRRRVRTNAKLSKIPPTLWGTSHNVAATGEIEWLTERQAWRRPGGARFFDVGGSPLAVHEQAPSFGGAGARSVSVGATDNVRWRRTTFDLAVRFNSRSHDSQDVPELDENGDNTGRTLAGRGPLPGWHGWSSRVGAAFDLRGNGEMILKGFADWTLRDVPLDQLAALHPGNATTRWRYFDPGTATYSVFAREINAATNLDVDSNIKPARASTYGAELSSELWNNGVLKVGFKHARSNNRHGWEDRTGRYEPATVVLPDGRPLRVLQLESLPGESRIVLDNPEGWFNHDSTASLSFRQRWSSRGELLAVYMFSNAKALDDWSGTKVWSAPLIYEQAVRFGEDPNDLTNSRGVPLNNVAHTLFAAASVEVPGIDLRVTGVGQYQSGRPYAAFAVVPLRQAPTPVFVEAAGSRRLPDQIALDLRLQRRFAPGERLKLDLLLDAANLLNQSSENRFVTANAFSPNFAAVSQVPPSRQFSLGLRIEF